MSTFNPGPAIWTDQQLSQWATDALGQITSDVHCIWAREALTITQGVSVVTLPCYVRTVRRVTWRGKSLDPLQWEEFILVTPATVFVALGSSANVETSLSRPLYYCMHPTNPYDLRLYPTPNESFNPTGFDPYSPQPNESACVVDYYRTADDKSPQINIPPYILRRTQKAYVMWKAFNAEGKGQDLKASKYYHLKYNFLIAQFRAINEGAFVAKKYAVDDGMLAVDGFRYPRPQLNPNFELVRF